MKRTYKALLVSFVFISIFSLLCSPALGATATVIDEIGRFGEAELAALESIETTYPIYLYLPSVSRYDDYRDVERYTEQMMSRQGIFEYGDAVILVVYKTDEWHYDLYTYGKANDEISDREVNRILDAEGVYGRLKAGGIADGFTAFAHEVERACGPRQGADLTGFIFLCVGIGAACAGIAVLIVVLRYRMKIRKTNYPLDRYASLSLTDKEDIYTTTTVTRQKISSSSSSGKGGGGGGRRGGR